MEIYSIKDKEWQSLCWKVKQIIGKERAYERTNKSK